eukprot:TRINITY_DN69537_c0_g1_i1.p1 TRINITY_DN69537_c0_g1~~TRINITY_DN69537_c0_g1_i1.p1  ORF type:complete len:462 (+),score=50.36 TRINITY_DN69537_c0_g1_i1:84-1469(+)
MADPAAAVATVKWQRAKDRRRLLFLGDWCLPRKDAGRRGDPRQELEVVDRDGYMICTYIGPGCKEFTDVLMEDAAESQIFRYSWAPRRRRVRDEADPGREWQGATLVYLLADDSIRVSFHDGEKHGVVVEESRQSSRRRTREERCVRASDEDVPRCACLREILKFVRVVADAVRVHGKGQHAEMFVLRSLRPCFGRPVRYSVFYRPLVSYDQAWLTLAEKLQMLDDQVATRSSRGNTSRELQTEDLVLVREIGVAVRQWVLSPHWKRRDVSRVDEQPGIMSRLYVYPPAGPLAAEASIEVRLHLFEDPAETYIHNHRCSFASYCLAGHYWHKIWNHLPAQSDVEDAVCYEFKRLADGRLEDSPTKHEGILVEAASHRHASGNVYLISATTMHTVLTTEAAGRVLTVYIRGVDTVTETSVWSMESSPAWPAPNGPERELTEYTSPSRSQILAKIVDVMTSEP